MPGVTGPGDIRVIPESLYLSFVLFESSIGCTAGDPPHVEG